MDPDSNTNEDAPLEADLPGWGESRRHALDQLDPTATTVTAVPTPNADAMATADLPPLTAQEAAAALDDLDPEEWFEELHDDRRQFEPTDPSPGPTSRRSAGKGNELVAAGAAQLFTTIAGAVSLFLNATIGRGSGVWVMQQQEAAGIGEPLGRIAARHAPIDPEEATDMGDAIEAGVGVAMYGARASIEHMTARATAPMPQGQEPQQ